MHQPQNSQLISQRPPVVPIDGREQVQDLALDVRGRSQEGLVDARWVELLRFQLDEWLLLQDGLPGQQGLRRDQDPAMGRATFNHPHAGGGGRGGGGGWQLLDLGEEVGKCSLG